MTALLSHTPQTLRISSRIEERLHRGELTPNQVNDFQNFLTQLGL
jgi:hypothetical protein